MRKKSFAAFSFLCLVLSACNNAGNNNNSGMSSNKEALESILANDSSIALDIPSIKDQFTKNLAVLEQQVPIVFLEQSDSSHLKAQQLAATDARFTENLFDKTSHKAFRNEIFNVYNARPQEIPKGMDAKNIYRVEMYNYALNLTSIAMVDIAAQQVISVNNYPQTQPEIPAHLKQIALKIAANAPEVINALGYKPGESDALMANTKTALNATKCERSMHLCVAPTFIKDQKALWAIVDLTDYKLVGIRWTTVGTSGADQRISERKLQFDKIMECNCKEVTKIEQNGWKMNYVITSSDGLRISEVYFNNKLIINNAKLVDWHVSYSGTDGFGYSDAVGCPEFSQAAVVAVTQPKIKTLEDNGKALGFVLEQTFSSEQWPKPCNYNYIQRYEFYNDGSFRVACGSLGRGCGSNGTYRPVTRILFANEGNDFNEWDGKAWSNWATEKWQLQNSQTSYTGEGYQYRVGDEKNGYYLKPGNGNFNDGGRGDNAFVFVTKYHVDKDEGESDLVTIGPCCNIDYHQGPEKFIEPNPENIQHTQLVVWYVAQLKNDDRPGNEYCWAESLVEKGIYKTKAYPCMSGPLFVPVKK